MFVTVCSFNMGGQASDSKEEIARLENFAEVYLLQDVPEGGSLLVDRLKEKGYSVHTGDDERYLVILSKRFELFRAITRRSHTDGYCRIHAQEVSTGKVVVFASAFFNSGSEGLTEAHEEKFFDSIGNEMAYATMLVVAGVSTDSGFKASKRWMESLPHLFESKQEAGVAFFFVREMCKKSRIERFINFLFSSTFVVSGFEKSRFKPIVAKVQMQGAGSTLLKRIGAAVAFLGVAALGWLFYTGQIALERERN